ncbi:MULTISPECIES: hypothetical protein [unclassified Deinococcus]|uniref:hypothetical protein n=1 Tax=unclassified Deinococcus TaxID=2623546 RepID=UPI001C2F7153|nr:MULTISPECIES: hypothetical protein [unclassified Deinococcus]MDK2013495.1 hypothetical protein [Deinococcus sp. 43]
MQPLFLSILSDAVSALLVLREVLGGAFDAPDLQDTRGAHRPGTRVLTAICAASGLTVSLMVPFVDKPSDVEVLPSLQRYYLEVGHAVVGSVLHVIREAPDPAGMAFDDGVEAFLAWRVSVSDTHS